MGDGAGAYQTGPIMHSSAFMGAIAGAVVGAAACAFVASAIVTGGATLAVAATVVGAGLAGGSLISSAGQYFGSKLKSVKGTITSGSANVFYGPAKHPAARAGVDMVMCTHKGGVLGFFGAGSEHGPKKIATGSSTVFINNEMAARASDKCECGAELSSEIDSIGIGGAPAIVEGLSVEEEVPEWFQKGRGYALDAGFFLMGAGAAGLAGSGLRCFAKTLLKEGFEELAWMAADPLAGAVGEAIGGKRGRQIAQGVVGVGQAVGNPKKFVRTPAGHPVDVATGSLWTEHTDFTIDGIIPITWTRYWASDSCVNGELGKKWSHPYDLKIVEIDDDILAIRLEEARLALFPRLEIGEGFYSRVENLYLFRKSEDTYWLRYENNVVQYFARAKQDLSICKLSRTELNGVEVMSFSYDNYDKLVLITHSSGSRLVFEYNKNNLIERIFQRARFSSRILVDYSYDDAGNMIASRNPEGAEIHYEYQGHLITKETLQSGLSFYFDWDDSSLPTTAKVTKTWGDGNLYYVDFKYDSIARKTVVKYLNGATRKFGYNDIGLVVEEVSPLGIIKKTGYNKYGELEFSSDGAGNTDVIAYDEFGRVISRADPQARKWRYEYSTDDAASFVFNNPSKVIDPEDNATTYYYDECGNMAQYIAPNLQKVTIFRDEQGKPLRVSDNSGVLAKYNWSQFGQILSVRNAAGGGVMYHYDAFGRIKTLNEDGQETYTFSYDDCDRVRVIQKADGAKALRRYDLSGNLTFSQDFVGNITKWEYGVYPFPYKRTNPDGTTFEYAYDIHLNLVELTNENGDSYKLQYDLDERLIREIGFDGRKQIYTYDDADYVVQSQDGERILQFERNRVGEMVKIQGLDGLISSYSYNKLGQILTAENKTRKIKFEYGEMGELLKEVQDEYCLTHEYDQRLDRIASILPDGRRVEIGYNELGLFNEIHYQGRKIVDLKRDKIGREIARNAGGINGEIEYDPQGRIQKQTAYKSKVGNPLISRNYGYDELGLINQIKDQKRGITHYHYDARQYLKRVSGSDSERFSFDPAGNLITNSHSSKDASIRHGRLMMSGDRHFQYDQSGNRTKVSYGRAGTLTESFKYDAQNQLVEVLKETPSKRTKTKFTYDALGRRVSKTTCSEKILQTPANDNNAVQPEWRSESTQWFLWNGDVLLSEGSGTESGPIDALETVYLYEPNSFRPAAQIRRHDKDAEAEVYIYWLDHLGTPQELTNENGEIVWQVALKAWGGIGEVYVEQVGNNLRFQGQYYDGETGLHYNRFRHYDPEAGIFINQDPIGLEGGDKLNAYVPNPVMWIDPLGLECEYTRVRHYTNRKGSKGIEADDMIIARDNNRIYVEPANKKPLSRVKAETKYQLKDGRGRDYVEFDVPTRDLEWIDNPRYGTPELTIKGNVDPLKNPNFVRRR